MSISLLELAAETLGDLTAEVVMVGAASLALWITDPQAPSARLTIDVDVTVEISTRPQFHRFEQRLRDQGFEQDIHERVICRWRHKSNGLILDAVPTEPVVYGFSSHWQAACVPYAIECQLPSGKRVRGATPPYLLAMKLEAFASRGKGDYLASKDFEDIVSLIDGRVELLEEVRTSEPDLRTFVAAEFSRMLDDRDFMDGVYGAIMPDPDSQGRVNQVVLPRIKALASLGEPAP